MASGDRRNTGRKPSGKKTKKLSQKEQSEQFKETARELGVDESGAQFQSAIDVILPKKNKRDGQA